MNSNLVYLAGPISGETYKGSTDWRKYVHLNTPQWIETMSPMRAKGFLEQTTAGTVVTGSYEENPLSSAKGINTRDYNDVRRSQAVFVNLLGAKSVSIGTVMEIAWAKAFRVPVVCCMDKDNKHWHPMLNDACGYIVETLDEGIYTLVALLSTDTQMEKHKAYTQTL